MGYFENKKFNIGGLSAEAEGSLDKKPKNDIEQLAAENLDKKLSAALATLRHKSLDLGGLHLPGIDKMPAQEIQAEPLTWNENAGVVLFTDKEGNKYELPSSEDARELLSSENGFTRVPGLGVPNLNDSNLWGKDRESNSAYRKWQSLVQESSK